MRSSFFVATINACQPGTRNWDEETKRRDNIRNHGIDFTGCETIFDNPVIVYEGKRVAWGELRLNAIGWFEGRFVHLAYTEREEDFHVISLREAEKHEIRRLQKEISR